MLKSFFSKFLILFCFIIVILFAYSNPEDITIGLWPLEKRLSIPIYFIVICTFTLGFIVGNISRVLKIVINKLKY